MTNIVKENIDKILIIFLIVIFASIRVPLLANGITGLNPFVKIIILILFLLMVFEVYRDVNEVTK